MIADTETLRNGFFLSISILGIALTSLAEAAFFAMPLQTVKRKAEGGNDKCKLLVELRSRLVLPVSSLLITHSVLSVISGMIIGFMSVDNKLVFPLFVYTIFQLIFCEIIPKAYGLLNAEKLVLHFASTISLLVKIFYPLAIICELVFHVVFRTNFKGNNKRQDL